MPARNKKSEFHLFQLIQFYFYSNQESDATIAKRNKFRAQKNSLKEEKEQHQLFIDNQSNNSSPLFNPSSSNSSSSVSSNSPSSFTSSPCRTSPTPSQQQQQLSNSVITSSNHVTIATLANESTPLCNTLNQAALAIQTPLTPGHIIKTIDRVNYKNFF